VFEAMFLISAVAYIAFRNWLEHDKRRMIHKERLAAIEKGVALPAVEQEVRRRSWNVQRYLLLAGWSFIFAGIAVFIAITMITFGQAAGKSVEGMPPQGAQYFGLIPAGVGVAHLITYYAGQKRDSQ
jgi:hypothetical protein